MARIAFSEDKFVCSIFIFKKQEKKEGKREGGKERRGE